MVLWIYILLPLLSKVTGFFIYKDILVDCLAFSQNVFYFSVALLTFLAKGLVISIQMSNECSCVDFIGYYVTLFFISSMYWVMLALPERKLPSCILSSTGGLLESFNLPANTLPPPTACILLPLHSLVWFESFRSILLEKMMWNNS